MTQPLFIQEGFRASEGCAGENIQEGERKWFSLLHTFFFFTRLNSLKLYRREILFGWFLSFQSCGMFFWILTFLKCINEQDSSQYLQWRLHRKIEGATNIELMGASAERGSVLVRGSWAVVSLGSLFPLMHNFPPVFFFGYPNSKDESPALWVKSSNSPCCLISSKLYIICFVFDSESKLLFSNIIAMIEIDWAFLSPLASVGVFLPFWW